MAGRVKPGGYEDGDETRVVLSTSTEGPGDQAVEIVIPLSGDD